MLLHLRTSATMMRRGAGSGQDFKPDTKNSTLKIFQTIYHLRHPPASSPPSPRPRPPCPAASPAPRRPPSPPPASPVATVPAMYATRDGQERDEPVRLNCEERYNINFAEAAGFDLRGRCAGAGIDRSGVQTPFVRDSGGRKRPRRELDPNDIPTLRKFLDSYLTARGPFSATFRHRMTFFRDKENPLQNRI